MATRGPKPKPTHLKLVEGNPGKRRIGHEPQPRQIAPTPPDPLDDLALEEWHRMATLLTNLGLLTEVDRSALAAYCQSYGRWAAAQNAIKELASRPDVPFDGLVVSTPSGAMIQNPLVGIANKAARDMVNFAAEFGMTPSARARLALGDPGGADPGDKFGGTLWTPPPKR